VSALKAPTDLARFSRLLGASHPCIHLRTLEEAQASQLVRQAALDRRLAIQAWKLGRGVYDPDFLDAQVLPGTDTLEGGLRHLLSQDAAHGVVLLFDPVPLLSEPLPLRLLRDLVERLARRDGHLVIIDPAASLPSPLETYASRFELSLPSEEELGEMIKELIPRERRRLKAPVRMPPAAWSAFLKNLRGLTLRQARQIVLDVISEDGEFTPEDLNHAMARKREILHREGLLEYVESPVSMAGIAGMSRLKAWLGHRKNAMTDEGRLFGLAAPRGILMLGVPGSGKSLCAKAVAGAWQRPLFRLDPGALYDKYIGESERRLRDSLRIAEAVSPIVLWIDEIEKGFAGAASRSLDGGLSQRMFGSLLTWMQEQQAGVFVVATANDIEALPPELLRKGRFDEIFFVDLPSEPVRRDILAVHLRRRHIDPAKYDLDALAAASPGFTGAELEQAVVAAMHESYGAKRKMGPDDVLEALRRSPPLSTTMREKVESLRAWAKGRCSPAD
jgi:hypothetical protein